MNYRKLSEEILNFYEKVAVDYSAIQKHFGLTCPDSCSKCCYNKEIYCMPYEWLPLVIHLYDQNQLEKFYHELKNSKQELCHLLKLKDEKNTLGHCEHYQFRPLLCRTFGVVPRKYKNENIEFSICKKIKEIYPNYEKIIEERNIEFSLIDETNRRLGSIDPKLLDKTYHINESLIKMIEEILLVTIYTKI